MAWWNRAVRIESLSSFSATVAQSLPRNLPGTHLQESLLEIVDWQERQWHEARKRSLTIAFWKSSVQRIWLKTKKCTYNTFIFIFSAICGFDFTWTGFTMLNLTGRSHSLDCFSCGLWTWRLNTFFHFSFCPPPLIHFILLPFSHLKTSPPTPFINLPSTLPSLFNSPLLFLFHPGPKTWRIGWLSCGGGMNPQEVTQPAS